MLTVERDKSPNKPLLTPNEFLEALDHAVGRNSLYGLIQAGKIRHLRLGRKILIPRSEVINFPARESEVQ